MKNYYLLLVLFISVTGYSQTTATDFTATDCDGNSYNLFSKLNDDKVVILAWVMPCATCITDPLEAYTIIQGYAASHPNRIEFSLVDDFANTTCSSLAIWAGQYGMGNAHMMSDAVISMFDYGVAGMPKVVILAGSNHTVYYNENSSTAGFQAALDLALAENPLAVDENESNVSELSIFPNPVNHLLNVSYSLNESSDVTYEIVDLLGAKIDYPIVSSKKQAGKNSEKIDLGNLANGTYFLKINTINGSIVKKFIVTK
jgi:hypothetical protein